ncbi:MAG: ABC transporter ATP-binding protein [Treponema sp.]|jgi:peptide/nickel transport system permease protein|nr:ABC transporter ATP-binding protein [Treponema sp.]
MPADILLEVENLTVSFAMGGRLFQVVRGLSFSLGGGEILGIVGESGSGKSVSTQAIPSLLPKNALAAGSVRYRGEELLGRSVSFLREYRGKKIGMIFQEPGRSYDPLQNMESVFFETFRNSEKNITKADAAKRAVSLLEETGLKRGKERLSNFPHQFSGGELQRIGIALALAQGCELLIADEPTTALDVTIQKQIVALLLRLKETRNISIIFISHDINLVAEIAGRVLVMYGGLVMEAGNAALFAEGAVHPYSKALLAASPRFGSHYSRERLRTIPGRVADPAHPEPGCPFAPRCAEAAPECREGVPPLTEGEGGHEARCVRLSWR